MKILIFVIVLVSVPVFYSQAQVIDDLKVAKQELKESYQRLVEIETNDELSQEEREQRELAAKKNLLKEVIEFSIAETNNLIAKISAFKNLPDIYAELQTQYLATLKGFLKEELEYLKRLDDQSLDLAGAKELAAEFKAWRENIYSPEIKKILNFILVFQGSDVLATANSRFGKIAADLKLLKNSKIIKIELLLPLLEEAGLLLKDASIFNKKGQDLLLAATSTPSVEISNIVVDMINKIKQAYGKFLEMSGLVKKMAGR